MRQHVAVRRHTLQEAPGVDGARRAWSRPSGRRLLLLVVLACAGVLGRRGELGAGGRPARRSRPTSRSRRRTRTTATRISGPASSAATRRPRPATRSPIPRCTRSRAPSPTGSRTWRPAGRAAGANTNKVPPQSTRAGRAVRRLSPARSAGPPTCRRTFWSTAQIRPAAAAPTIRCSRREPPRAVFRSARRRRS